MTWDCAWGSIDELFYVCVNVVSLSCWSMDFNYIFGFASSSMEFNFSFEGVVADG